MTTSQFAAPLRDVQFDALNARVAFRLSRVADTTPSAALMNTADVRWAQTFPYRSGEVIVTRTQRGWRLAFFKGGTEAEGRSLVEAFEALTRRHASHHELAVIGTALVMDRTPTSAGVPAPEG